jgi:hypothetical protein
MKWIGCSDCRDKDKPEVCKHCFLDDNGTPSRYEPEGA